MLSISFEENTIVVLILYFRDAIIVSLGDGLTSVFGGFVIFSYLGYMAGQLKVDVKDVVQSGEYFYILIFNE